MKHRGKHYRCRRSAVCTVTLTAITPCQNPNFFQIPTDLNFNYINRLSSKNRPTLIPESNSEVAGKRRTLAEKIPELLLFDSPSSELLFENQEHGKVPEIEMKLSIPVRGVDGVGIGDSPVNPASPSPLQISHSILLI